MVSADHIRREQQRDEFAKELLRRLQESGQEYVERIEGTAPRSGAKLRIAKFAELDGLLFRITEASDPREGFDSTRVYVPPALRQKVIRSGQRTLYGTALSARTGRRCPPAFRRPYSLPSLESEVLVNVKLATRVCARRTTRPRKVRIF